MAHNPLTHGTRHRPPSRVIQPDDCDDDWPVCTIGRCDEQYPPRRHELGYRTCLRHSALDPMNSVPPLIVQDVNKSNPSITRRTDFLNSAYADRRVASDLRSSGVSSTGYVRLSAFSNPNLYPQED